MRDHDLPKVPTALEMAVGRLSLGKWECSVDHRVQAVQSDGAVHRLEIGSAADADRPDGNAVAAQQ